MTIEDFVGMAAAVLLGEVLAGLTLKTIVGWHNRRRMQKELRAMTDTMRAQYLSRLRQKGTAN